MLKQYGQTACLLKLNRHGSGCISMYMLRLNTFSMKQLCIPQATEAQALSEEAVVFRENKRGEWQPTHTRFANRKICCGFRISHCLNQRLTQ